jgi:hypothetical protein
MKGREMSGDSALGLADAIEDLREQLELARARADSADMKFPIHSVTIELRIVAAREGSAKAGFKVPVIDLEVGASGKISHEATHRLVIEFGGPVSASGQPIRVDRVSSVPLD